MQKLEEKEEKEKEEEGGEKEEEGDGRNENTRPAEGEQHTGRDLTGRGRSPCPGGR